MQNTRIFTVRKTACAVVLSCLMAVSPVLDGARYAIAAEEGTATATGEAPSGTETPAFGADKNPQQHEQVNEEKPLVPDAPQPDQEPQDSQNSSDSQKTPTAETGQANGTDANAEPDPAAKKPADRVPVDPNRVNTDAALSTGDKVAATAGTVVVDGLKYVVNPDGGTATVAGWSGAAAPKGDVIVAAFVVSGADEYTVTSIADEAFKGCGEIESIVLPDSLEKLGKDAFKDCASLLRIEIGDRAEHFAVHDGMLFDKQLETLLVCPAGKLPVAQLPASMTAIAEGAFAGCRNLEAFQVAEGSQAFTTVDGVLYSADRTQLVLAPARTVSVIVAPETKTIAAGAFAACTGLASVIANGYVEAIETGAFPLEALSAAKVALASGDDYDARKAVWREAGFSNFIDPAVPGEIQKPETSQSGFVFELLEDYTLAVSWAGENDPDPNLVIPATGKLNDVEYRVSAIAAGGFQGRESLSSVQIRAPITVIGDDAFAGCTGLASVELSEGVSAIGADAFAGTAVQRVVVPTSVSSVGARAFADCPNLSQIVTFSNAASVAGDAIAGCSGVAIYAPYSEAGAYPWNPGLVASGNHILPYGISFASDPVCVAVDETADLFEGGVREVPEGCELTYSYAATPISVDAGQVTGKKPGTSEVVAVLSMDGVELGRAVRVVEVVAERPTLFASGGSARAGDKYYLTATFDTDGGTPQPTSQPVEVSTSLSVQDGYYVCPDIDKFLVEPAAPSKPGYRFLGWYGKKSDEKFDFTARPMLLNSTDTRIDSYVDDISQAFYSISLIAKWAPAIPIPSDALASGETGPAGDSVTWYITAQGELVLTPTNGISGTLGEFADYRYVPWYEHRKSIKKATIEAGVKTGSRVADMFVSCGQLSVINGLRNLDTSKATDMGGMFSSCSSLTSLDVSNFDTKAVTDMATMFFGCSSLTSLDVSNLDTSSVKDMNQMFSGCSGLTSLDVSNFDTSKVTEMPWMFSGCSGLTSLDVSNLDTSSVTDMRNVFDGCSNLESLDLSNFDTSNVAYSYGMFRIAPKLTAITISAGFANVRSDTFVSCSADVYAYGAPTTVEASQSYAGTIHLMSAAASGAKSLWTNAGYTVVDDFANAIASGESGGCSWAIYQGGQMRVWPTNGKSGELAAFGTTSTVSTPWYTHGASVTSVVFSPGVKAGASLNFMFYDFRNLASIDFADFDTSGTTHMEFLFRGCISLQTLDLSSFSTSSAKYMSYMFYGCSGLQNLDLSSFDTSGVTSMFNMFCGCRSLDSLDLSSFDTSKTENMEAMFSGCNRLQSPDLSNFDTSNATNMRSMFKDCRSFKSLDVSNFNTSKVTDLAYMFSGCSGLPSLNVSNFNTSMAMGLNHMFSGCSGLQSLDLSSFDTLGVKYMSYMFYGCSGLQNLDLSSFDTSSATSTTDMFSNCPKLSQIKVGAKYSLGFLSQPGSQFGYSGNWVNLSGKSIAYNAIPPNVVDTYKAELATYTISYELNDGTQVANPPTSFTIESPAVTLPTPTRTGYSFAGWYNNSGLTGSAVTTIPAKSTGNKTFYAKWTPNNYAFTLGSATGVNTAGSTATGNVAYGSTVTLKAAANAGYQFVKWKSSNTSLVPDKTTANATFTMPAGAVTMTPEASLITYTIGYELNGGTQVANPPTSYNVANAVTLPTPTKVGCSFAGWYENASFTGNPVSVVTNTTGNKTYYAKWTPNKYKYTLGSATGIDTTGSTASGDVSFGSPVLLKAAAKSGYQFSQWTSSNTALVPSTALMDTSFLMPAGALSMTPSATLLTYKIEYELNDGTQESGAIAQYNVETTVKLPTSPIRTGYTFAGWYDNEALSGNPVTTIAVGTTGDKKYYAKWTLNSYQFTLGSVEGVDTTGSTASGMVSYGADVTLKAAAQSGYVFAGWKSSDTGLVPDAAEANTTFTMPLGPVTMTPSATLSTYTIAYVLNDGELQPGYPAEFTVKSDPITLPTPTKAGYGFAGWYSSPDFVGEPVTAIAAGSTGNRTYYAKWDSLEPLVFTLNQDGASLSVSVNPGMKDIVTSVNIPSSYNFEGQVLPVTRILGADVAAGTSGGFQGCANLTRVLMAEGIASVGASAFAGCPKLVSLDLPDSLTQIEASAFENCTSLGSIALPNAVSSVGANAFLGCSNLADVTLSSNLTSLGAGAFKQCAKLEAIALPDGIAAIEDGVFQQSGLISIELPAGLQSIGASAFESSALQAVELPEGLTSIGGRAFASTKLASVELPSALGSVGAGAFASCANLASVFAFGSMSGAGVAGAFDDAAKAGARVYLPVQSADGSESYADMATAWGVDGYGFQLFAPTGGSLKTTDYQENGWWSFDLDGTLTIGCKPGTVIADLGWVAADAMVDQAPAEGAWSPLRGLVTNVVMEPGIAAQNTGAWFAGMTKLTDASQACIPAKTQFANSMFAGCTSLTQLPAGLAFPETTTSARGTFKGCTALTSLPADFSLQGTRLTHLNSLFDGTGLTLLPNGFAFPEAAADISRAFAGTGLTQLPNAFAIPGGAGLVIDGLFAQCTKLAALPTGFVVPGTVASAQQAFANCSSLTALPAGFSLPEGANVTEMLAGCSQLASLPASLKLTGLDETMLASLLTVGGDSPLATFYAGDKADVPAADYWTATWNRTLVTSENPSTQLVAFKLPDASGTYAGDAWMTLAADADGMLASTEAPARDGFTFLGWFVDEACTIAFDFTKSVTAQAEGAPNPVTTLYARYVASALPLPTIDGGQHASWELTADGTLHIMCEDGYTIADLGWDASNSTVGHWGPVRSQVKRIQMDANVQAQSMACWFMGMSSLTDATGTFIPEGVEDIQGLFRSCPSLAKLPDGFVIPEGVKCLDAMFFQAAQLVALPDSFVLPDSTETVAAMFEASALQSLPTGFTIPNNVTSTGWMFQSCTQLTELPEGFQLPSNGALTQTKCMFNMAENLRALPVGFTVPASVSNASWMFGSCKALTVIPEGFSLPARADFKAEAMFEACNKLSVLPASLSLKGLMDEGWDPSANGVKMFYLYPNQSSVLDTLYMGSSLADMPDAAWWTSQRRTLLVANDPDNPLPSGVRTVTFKTASIQNPGTWDVYVTTVTDENGKLAAPADPNVFGYPFKAWYADEACTTKFDFDTATITENGTVIYGTFGGPIVRGKVPITANVVVDNAGGSTTDSGEIKSFTPVATKLTSVACQVGPGAAEMFPKEEDRVKPLVTVRFPDVVPIMDPLKVPFTGEPAKTLVDIPLSTGFASPGTRGCDISLDLNGAQVLHRIEDHAANVAGIVWTIEVK